MIINNLGKFKAFAFTQLLLLLALKLYSQTPTPAALSGNGTSGDPYQISSESDWNAFAAAVNAGYSYSGDFIKLTANIGTAADPVTTMVGDLVDAVYYSFKGTFDGDDHTLTFHYNYTEPSSQHLNRVAPFRYINGATIKKLRVAGDINMDKPNAGGLFCVNDIYNDSKSYIIDCTVSVNITGYKDYCGGFAAVASNTTFTGCVYNGRLNIGRYSGGFSAQGNKKTIIDNCLCAPTAGSEIYSRSGNFVNEKNAVITNSYYTLLPNPDYSILTQGTRAYTSVPPAEPAVFTRCQPLIDNNYYYVEGNATIINLPDGYDYTGSEIAVTYGMTFEGTELTEGTDFIASFSPSPVLPKGTYTMTLNGNNSNYYYGSISRTFEVIDGYLQGEGTAEDPYLIEYAHDWEVFTDKISLGIDVDKYYKLNKNLSIGTQSAPITTLVGTDEHQFCGHFDGGWHTLEIHMERTDEQYAAPFGVINNAVIENLAVTGTIKTNHKYAAGIVAFPYGTSTISNCISSVEIDCSDIITVDPDKPYDCSHGGLVAKVVKDNSLTIENCIFNGSIVDKKAEKTAQRCAGFCSFREGSITYINCTMAGTISIAAAGALTDNTANFHRNPAGHSGGTFTNAYYITPSAQQSNQGTEITSSAIVPTDGIYRKYTVSANNYYVQGGIISGLEITTFTYTGSVIPIDPVITYYGWTLAKDTDYTVGLTYSETEEGGYSSIDEIQEAGYYKMTITGINNYGGSKVYTIHVVDVITSWLALKTALTDASGTISVYRDLSDVSNDGALVVSGNMVLDLNGHTLNRNRTAETADGCVIKVESGASLRIINGTITGGRNSGSGGGIYSEGNLTLNDVVVVNNKCTATGGGIYCKTGSFKMTGGGIIRNQTTVNGNPAGGGGIYADLVAAFEMNNVTVTENSTISKGGGIRLHIDTADTYNINNCTITKNTSSVHPESKGGGIYFDSDYGKGSLNVSGGLICVNTVDKEGGGVYVNHGKVSIQDCNLMGNIVSNGIGGAVSAYGGNHSKIILDGCGINGNSSKNQGGGVYVGDGATIEIQGELRIIGNESKDTESNNLYLAKSDEVITVVGSLPGAVIGVSRSGAGTLTSGLAGHGTIGNFISECGTRVVLPVGGEAYLQNYYIWGVTEGWPNLDGITKDDDDNYTVAAVVAIPKNSVATANSITTGVGLLIIEDGGQLVTGSASLAKAQIKKIVNGSTADDNGWYLIASPVANPNIASATNLITTGVNKYDLYRYNEASDLQWENYRAGHEDFTTLENGRGYLYRNENDHTINVSGTLNVSDVSYSLSYNATTAPSGNNNTLKGFNLIGNPYSHNIYKNDVYQEEGDTPAINDADLAVGYYVLNSAADAFEAKIGYNNPIKPCDAILVQTTSAHDLVITNTINPAAVYVEPGSGEKRKSGYENIMFEIANNEHRDVAYAMFIDGAGLNKIEHMNADVPMLYIHQYDEDYAIATMNDNVKSISLNFKAKTTGYYTLSVQPQGEFGYLHLIDKLTGSDVDMLKEEEYTFIGSAADKAERFVVRLSPSTSTGSETFAYQSGDDIIVEGEGELEVFDVMGRLMMKKNVNGLETIEKPSQTGVYIFRLDGQTQKIVVR